VIVAVVSGLGFGLSLIVAIGAQNAFVLRQGLRREYVAAIVLVCTASDAVLISAGVGGLGALVEAAPVILTVARLAGAAFLLGYAMLAARRALRPGALTATVGGAAAAAPAVLASCLALTWLNPHVYLDTVVLVGSVASAHGSLRWWFGLGAAIGSAIWFSALGFGARLLSPLAHRRTTWRVLDAGIALIMLGSAATLLLGLH
jgi:L-lysine exporter family protein LysE/ArgO